MSIIPNISLSSFFSLYQYPLFSLYISILFCPYQVIIPLSSHLSVLTSQGLLSPSIYCDMSRWSPS